MQPKLLACIGFLYKLYTKLAVSESLISLAGIKLRLKPFETSNIVMKLGTLVLTVHHLYKATKRCKRGFNFCLGTQLWSFDQG